MIPLGDDNSLRKTVPVVTYALILLNVIVFLIELGGGEDFIMKWSFIPSHFVSNPAANFSTIISAMFMHAGWGHLVGNMLYLWIFGDNVEDRFGKLKFLVFYIVCGVAATLAQMAIDPASNIPNVGASGAIAGVLGAYILLFPGEKVNVLLGAHTTQLPALIVIGFWFILQFLSGVSSPTAEHGQETGGVAYMAHIGGFVAGLMIAGIFRAMERNKTPSI